MKIDDINIAIIKELHDGRLTFKKIAEELGVSENSVRGRVAKLRQDGVLEINGLVEFYTEEVARLRDVQSVETFVVYKAHNLKTPYIF